MTSGCSRKHSGGPTANVGHVGPEPAGATPIQEDELHGLIPDYVATRADLNQVEFESIARSLPGLLMAARTGGPEALIDYGFLLDTHRRMFRDVWRWAGTLRRLEATIGVAPDVIPQLAMQCLDDARYWHARSIYGREEIAVRLHAKLVAVHPFPNGNGRSTRLMADLYLTSTGQPSFTWGAASLDVGGNTRERYIKLLVDALATDEYGPLIIFARS